MSEMLVYAVALAGFVFVLVATARMSHDLLALACVPPVFVSLVMAFTMGIYAWDSFGVAPVAIPVVAAAALGWHLAARYSSRDLLIFIYLAWAVGMAAAVIGFQFPDAA
ncbi:MAG: hypothetical protein AB7O80_04325 [Acetobacteraceae bacterium]